MNQRMVTDDFEQRLLEHVEVLYAVALKLTHHHARAERITRATLLQAWHWGETWDGTRRLKSELLKLLRRTFIVQYGTLDLRDSPWALGANPLIESEDVEAGLCRRESSPMEKIGLVAT